MGRDKWITGAKLTEADVRQIRADPRFADIVAREYKVSERTIQRIRARRAWQHVK